MPPKEDVHRRTLLRATLSLICVAFLPVQITLAQEAEQEESPLADWLVGPANGQLGSIAEIQVPEGYLFGDGDQTRELLETMENPTSGSELGCLMMLEEDDYWFVVFDFDLVGYVKDDEKEELDADAMLASMKEGTQRGNELRRQRGWEEIELVGWAREPFYDEATNNLEWATILRSTSGGQSVNFNTRLLGRRGVMSATLIASPEHLTDLIPTHHALLANHTFVSGQRYHEFVAGDKVAEYGLTALVTGGALAVAAKTGLLARFWKLIVVGLVALGGAIKRIFGGGRAEAA